MEFVTHIDVYTFKCIYSSAHLTSSSYHCEYQFKHKMKFIVIVVVFLLCTVYGQEILKYSIEEKSSIGTIIAELARDLHIQTVASFSLVELLPINRHLITINHQTGQLITATNLDREQLCLRQQCSCELCIFAFQLFVRKETTGTTMEKIIELRLEDRNDHSPTFEKQSMTHVIHIKANVPLGYRIVLPSANDPDEGLNSVQTYRLEGPNADDFDVDFSSLDTPYLIVRSSLDRPDLFSFALTLIASDHGQQPKPRAGSIPLEIRLTNNSIPSFQQSVYRIDVREDALIGTTVLKVEANSETERNIFYELVTDSPFIIDRVNGQIQLKQLLDYEREKSYRLTIKAYENDVPTYAIVFIRVIDVNDNPAAIHIRVQGNTTLKQTRNDQNVLSIPEDTAVGTILAHVLLNDFDSFANGNPYLQLTTIQTPLPLIYKLVYQNNFQNTKLYSLILHTRLDREVRSLYNHIQILAHDSGTPTLHTKLSLLLNVTDVNDCVPQIINEKTIYTINENNPIGLIIDRLNGTDCDLGLNGQFEYRLLNRSDLLLLNTRTGQLTLNQSIDFEQLTHNKYEDTVDLEFWIQIQDLGQPSLASQKKLILRIRDLNDHLPVFDSQQSFNWIVTKSVLRANAVLGRVVANDEDSGLQGIVHYKIQSWDPCFSLNITSLGYVYLPKDFSCSSGSYQFDVIASDYAMANTRSTKKTLTIDVQNDQIGLQILPKRIPIATQRTVVDLNSMGNISFLLDLDTNQSIEPRLYLNHSDSTTMWSISSTGEVRLLNQSMLHSSLLTFHFIDEFTKENYSMKLQIDLCNSSILNSCKSFLTNDDPKENQWLLVWAISLAFIITCLCVFLFAVMTCLCCRKPSKTKPYPNKKTNFLQCHDAFQSEKTLQSSAGSTIRDDDHDSACVFNTNSSLSSSQVPVMTSHSWDQPPMQRKDSNSEIYQPSTYFYDLKLAEFIRHNQYPPCVHLNAQPCQSLSTDYGFGSSEPFSSSSSYASTTTLPVLPEAKSTPMKWTTENRNEQIQESSVVNRTTFVSSQEYVV